MREPPLATRWLGRPWRGLPECGSTNDEAAAWARSGAPHGAVVAADSQAAGRGRLGRAWHSPADENLYLSIILRPSVPPRDAPPLTLAAAVALAEAAARAGGEPEIKWPNDLLVGGRKVAGILCELVTAGARLDFVVLGIGVNLNAREFPGELAGRATSLALALGRPVDRSAFAALLCERLEAWLDRLIADGPAPILDRWRSFARLFGRPVTIDVGPERLSGVAEDLSPEGALLLRRADGTVRTVMSGSICGS